MKEKSLRDRWECTELRKIDIPSGIEVPLRSFWIETLGDLLLAKEGYYVRYGKEQDEIALITSDGLFDLQTHCTSPFGSPFDFTKHLNLALNISETFGLAVQGESNDNNIYAIRSDLNQDEKRLFLGKFKQVVVPVTPSRSNELTDFSLDKNLPVCILVPESPGNSGYLELSHKDGRREEALFLVDYLGGTISMGNSPILWTGGTVFAQENAKGGVSLFLDSDPSRVVDGNYCNPLTPEVAQKGGIYITPIRSALLLHQTGHNLTVTGAKVHKPS